MSLKLAFLPSSAFFPGEHIQHDDDQLSEGGRAERHAVLGHLLHLLRLRGALRVRRHPPTDEGKPNQYLSDLTVVKKSN